MTDKTWDKTWGKIKWYSAYDSDVAKKVADLIEKGADINLQDNEMGYTPLIWAASRGKNDTAKKLIEYGADVNKTDKAGRTALMHAVINREEIMTALLLRNGAFVNARDFAGFTSAMYAAENDDTEIFKLLMDEKIDLSIENNFGANVWHSSHPGSEIRRIIRRSVLLPYVSSEKVNHR